MPWPYGGDWSGLDANQMVEVVVSLCNAVTERWDAIGFNKPNWTTKTGLKNGLLTESDLVGMLIQGPKWYDIIAEHIHYLILADQGSPSRTRAYVSGFVKTPDSSGQASDEWTEASLTAAVGLGPLTQKNFPQHTIFDAKYATRLQKFLDRLTYARVLPVRTVNTTELSQVKGGYPYTGPPHPIPPGPGGGWDNAIDSWTPYQVYSTQVATGVSGSLFASVSHDGVDYIEGSDRYGPGSYLDDAKGIYATMNTHNGLGFKGVFTKNKLVVAYNSLSTDVTVSVGGHAVHILGNTGSFSPGGLGYSGNQEFDHIFPNAGLQSIPCTWDSGVPPFTGRWGVFFAPLPSFVEPACGMFDAKPILTPDFVPANGSSGSSPNYVFSYCILDISSVLADQ